MSLPIGVCRRAFSYDDALEDPAPMTPPPSDMGSIPWKPVIPERKYQHLDKVPYPADDFWQTHPFVLLQKPSVSLSPNKVRQQLFPLCIFYTWRFFKSSKLECSIVCIRVFWTLLPQLKSQTPEPLTTWVLMNPACLFGASLLSSQRIIGIFTCIQWASGGIGSKSKYA